MDVFQGMLLGTRKHGFLNILPTMSLVELATLRAGDHETQNLLLVFPAKRHCDVFVHCVANGLDRIAIISCQT